MRVKSGPQRDLALQVLPDNSLEAAPLAIFANRIQVGGGGGVSRPLAPPLPLADSRIFSVLEGESAVGPHWLTMLRAAWPDPAAPALVDRPPAAAGRGALHAARARHPRPPHAPRRQLHAVRQRARRAAGEPASRLGAGPRAGPHVMTQA